MRTPLATGALVATSLIVACAGPPAPIAPTAIPATLAPIPAPAPPARPGPSVAQEPGQGPPPSSPPTLDERVARIQREAIIVDTHDDITSAILQDGFDLGKPNGKTATDLPKMRAGGITAEFFSIYVDKRFYEHPTSRNGGAARRALDMIDVTYQQLDRHPDALVLATSAEGIRRAKAEGKIAILMGIEGGHAIENSLYALRDFYRLGVRYMTLTHTNNNDWADASGFLTPPPPAHHGLSPFGEDVVREMQRIGMLVDVSHVSDETFAAVMRVARAPVIASHSSARALCDSPRNLNDDELAAMKKKNGGVVMVNFYPGFLDPKFLAATRAFQAKHKAELDALTKLHLPSDEEEKRIKAMGPADLPKTPLSILVDHIEHIARVAGVDHVGLGSDFDGVSALPEGLSGIDGLPNLTRALLERGFEEGDVKKILGENFLRAMAEAEAYAASTKTTLSGDGSVRKLEDK